MLWVSVQTGTQVSGGNMAAEEQNVSCKVTTENIFIPLTRPRSVLKCDLSERQEAQEFVQCHVSFTQVCEGELM